MAKKYLLISLFFSILATSYSWGQCRSFTRRMCIPQLEPYIHDGQVNSTVIKAGETVELYKTFYEGQDYRVVVCADNEFDTQIVRFRLLDHNRKVLYDNAQHNYATSWDFIASATQQVMIEVNISESDGEDAASGCLSILVGFLNKEGFFGR